MEELEKEKHKLTLGHETLKNEKVNLDESLKDLVKKNKNLIKKNKNLTKDLEKTKSLIDRFTLSSTRLDMMLKSQRTVFDKAGLGYRCYDKQKTINYLYKKSSKDHLTCFHCGKVGHKSYTCRINNSKVKQVWVIKGTNNSNPKGPKIAWVPKNT